MRLDLYLIEKKIANTRNEATKLIKNGNVIVNNQIIIKPNFNITDHDVKVSSGLEYVSRAGDKLAFALSKFELKIEGLTVLDIGASTGGFADACLQNNIKEIFCIDVGSNQMHEKISSNKKVHNIENTNIKDINTSIVNMPIDLVVSDLSFISSKYMFESLNKINLKDGANIISLIKPQFELEKEVVNKFKGNIQCDKLHSRAISNVCEYAKAANLKIIAVEESPILGAKKQNKEFFIWCQYGK
ncbi:MAG: TlyA family RNA methyltransferase [Mycoplasma sp.]